MDNTSQIAIFDSGIGGLTVLEELLEVLPNENYLYLADSYNFPYGIKSKEELEEIVARIGEYLMSENIKIIVIACNTASIYSNILTKIFTIPVIEIIKPTVIKTLITSPSNNILILGTKTTIESRVYEQALKAVIRGKASEGYNIYSLALSKLVERIEEEGYNKREPFTFVEDCLGKYSSLNIDTVVLACTHFPIYMGEIKSVFKEANIVSSSSALREVVVCELANLRLLNPQKTRGNVAIKVTRNEEIFAKKLQSFNIDFSSIEEIKF